MSGPAHAARRRASRTRSAVLAAACVALAGCHLVFPYAGIPSDSGPDAPRDRSQGEGGGDLGRPDHRRRDRGDRDPDGTRDLPPLDAGRPDRPNVGRDGPRKDARPPDQKRADRGKDFFLSS